MFDPAQQEFGTASRFGAGLFAGADDDLGSGRYLAFGTWAVTAP